MSLAEKYQKKTDKEHILSNPDTYIGSVEIIDNYEYIFDDEVSSIIQKEIKLIPGLFKLFDEAIVNARDHVIRMLSNCDENKHNVSKIEVNISDDGIITLYNDGNGIDVEKHPEYNIWIPEMIFAHLRTGTNYNKDEKKIVGGKNGFGVKLIYIWSTFGELETIDHKRGLKYYQKFTDNLNELGSPVITKSKVKPFTKVTFKPDYKRFGIENISQNMISLLKKRTYDIAAVTNKSVKVKWNNEILPVKDFTDYVDMYIGKKNENNRVHELFNDRWEYVIALSKSDEFQQVSFVNGIFTAKGGKHVEYVLNQIVKKIIAVIQKKKKMDVKPAAIKDQLMLFLRCDIENPAFDSQTKDYMNTPVSKFGSTCSVSDKFIDKIIKLGVMEQACEVTTIKENKTAKKSDGAKSKNVRGIPKLVDANYAGTSKSHLCTIIFCEGDSAKAGIISGLSKDDRNIYGIYPMKGKLFNVRGETLKKINENKEIIEIKQIIGLEADKVYDSLDDVKSKLRYGKILFMTDQDLDGSHIKGLCVNLFENQWASLIKLKIIGFMNTPILKAKKGQQEINFYTENDYIDWKENKMVGNWHIKYYKGLGTSSSKEFKEYFKEKRLVYFTLTDKCLDNIDMVFNKKRANDRKKWLENYDRKDTVNTNNAFLSYTEFFNKEMKHFSKYDCDRSIPNLMDGLKISQRKILYSAFKKNLNTEIKVAQFSGYVSEHSCYHHGEASLNGAIIGLAQDFVGSNNINLFKPNGQFGTRLNGGKDSASERYIFTQLDPVTRYIFRQEDDPILNYLYDDGTRVEPIYYVPIIPMLLVNGSKGIGTGFSTDISCYNPITIINYISDKLQNKSAEHYEFLPYFNKFNGNVKKISNTKYLIYGSYKIINQSMVHITELPIGVWTDDYKKYIESLISDNKSNISDYTDLSTDTTVDFTIKFNINVYKLTKNKNELDVTDLEKLLKLVTSISYSNMNAFDENECLTQFNDISTIIDKFMVIRYHYYDLRKKYIVNKLENELSILKNKCKYINYILEDKLDFRKKSKANIISSLISFKFDIINNDSDFNYLIKMPMDSVSKENVDDLMSKYNDKVLYLNTINKSSLEQMWLNDLNELLNKLT